METNKTGRRDLLRWLAVSLAALPGHQLFAATETSSRGNFRYIYGNAGTRTAFKQFLVNVFHLYPQDELHALIERSVQQYPTDAGVYQAVQAGLSGIKPLLGDLTYALPTLAKQKRVLCEQTKSLLEPHRRYDGYLEIGSHGRFLDALEEQLDIQGEFFTMGDPAPSYTPFDIVDRGQLTKAGTSISLNDYRPALKQTITARSLDLVTVYIGFHHCPVDLRLEFLGSIRDVLRPGGSLIVRDHDVVDQRMWHMVGLAHDVFNLGTKETWNYNQNERRNFYSLATLDTLLKTAGFKPAGRLLLQDGDPTLNTLMKYIRV